MNYRERTEEHLRNTNSLISRWEACLAESPDDLGVKLNLGSLLNLRKQFEAQLEAMNATTEPAPTPRVEASPVLEPEHV